jgi:prepilin-type processing-associated H-X9-DG protein
VFPGSCAINCTNGDDIGNNYPDSVYGTNGTGETYAFHAGGANVLFGDGSVRFLSMDIDIATFGVLVTRASGEFGGNRRWDILRAAAWCVALTGLLTLVRGLAFLNEFILHQCSHCSICR